MTNTGDDVRNDSRPVVSAEEVFPELPDSGEELVSADEYLTAYGEKLSQTLDLDTWQQGADLIQMYARLEEEIAGAVRKEGEYRPEIREKIFPLLRTRPGETSLPFPSK